MYSLLLPYPLASAWLSTYAFSDAGSEMFIVLIAIR